MPLTNLQSFNISNLSGWEGGPCPRRKLECHSLANADGSAASDCIQSSIHHSIAAALTESPASAGWAAVRLATQIEQHPIFGCINRPNADYADTDFFSARNHIIAAIRRLKLA